MTQQTAIVLAAHGSTANEFCNRALKNIAIELQTKVAGSKVITAFLDGMPDVRTVIHDIDADDVLVIPFMASDGYYTNVVFRNALKCAGKCVRFTNAIGSHPRMSNIVANRLSRLLDHSTFKENPSEVAVTVVGHGTKKNRNSCRSTICLVKELRLAFPGQRIEFGFIDQNPSIELVAKRISHRHAIVIPFLMGLGPHTTHDVPLAFGLRQGPDWCDTSTPYEPHIETVAGSDGSGTRKIVYDLPVGIWPEMIDLCHSILLAADQGQLDSNDGEVPTQRIADLTS